MTPVNNITLSHDFKREFSENMSKNHPNMFYEGQIEEYEDPADYLDGNMKLRGVVIA